MSDPEPAAVVPRGLRKRRWWRLPLGGVLLLATLWFVDARETWENLAHAHLGLVATAVGLTIPLTLLMAWRWHYTAARVDLWLPWPLAIREYYLGLLLNQTLFGVAGDVTRVVRHSGTTAGPVEPVLRSVLIERLLGQAALAVALVVSALSWERADLMQGLAVAGGGLGLMTLGVVVVLRHARLSASRPGRWMARLWRDAKTSVLGRALPIQLSVSLVIVGLLIAIFYACAKAVDVPMTPTTALLVVPWVLAATTIPLTVGGWGVREATSAGLFGLAGLDPAQGAAASVVFGAASLVGAAPGLLFMVPAQTRRGPGPKSGEEDDDESQRPTR